MTSCVFYALFKASGKFVYDETRPQFGFEPSRLGGHDVARVGNIHELFHRDGVEGESHFHLSAVDTAFQLFETAYAAYEVDAFVAAQVGDAQNVAQNQVRRNRDIEYPDGVVVVVGAGSEYQSPPR